MDVITFLLSLCLVVCASHVNGFLIPICMKNHKNSVLCSGHFFLGKIENLNDSSDNWFKKYFENGETPNFANRLLSVTECFNWEKLQDCQKLSWNSIPFESAIDDTETIVKDFFKFYINYIHKLYVDIINFNIKDILLSPAFLFGITVYLIHLKLIQSMKIEDEREENDEDLEISDLEEEISDNADAIIPLETDENIIDLDTLENSSLSISEK